MKNYKNFKRAFTLVELIIVIAIIAILAVTAFLLLTKWLSKARDSSRASNLANIEKSLQISLTDKSSLPKPDNYTLIYASGTSNVVGYQGDFGEGAKDSVGNINSAPKDGDDYFLYYLSNDLRSYQLGTLLENETAYNPNTVTAVDYSSRFINVRGNQLGMLFDSSKNPVNKLGLTGVDIQNTTSNYTAYFDNKNKVSGTGFILKSLRGGGNLAYGLVGYWSFDLSTGTYVYDDIKGTYKGLLSGGVSLTGGKFGSGLYFNGIDGVVEFGKISDFDWGNGDGTVSVWFHTNKAYSDYGVMVINGHGRHFGRRYILHVDANTNLCRFDIDDDGSHNLIQVNTTPTQCNNGNRNNLVGVKKGNTTYIYLNGLRINEQNIPSDYSSLDSPIGLRFGMALNQTSSANYSTGLKYEQAFSGYLDDIRIYDRAITESEVKALYDATK